MPATITASSRRKFIRFCSSTTALLCSGMLSLNSKAGENTLLASRVGATPLLLNYNESSLGMSPLAVNAAVRATASLGNRYPDESVAQLRESLAEKHGVDSAQIILGNGSTEVIQAVVTMAEGYAATVIEPAPTSVM